MGRPHQLSRDAGLSRLGETRDGSCKPYQTGSIQVRVEAPVFEPLVVQFFDAGFKNERGWQWGSKDPDARLLGGKLATESKSRFSTARKQNR